MDQVHFKSHLCRVKHILLILLVLFSFEIYAQGVLIHAHNDYQKKEPLIQAIKHRIQYIEVDVYLIGNKLLVAHDIAELPLAPTLEDIYLKPISGLFKLYKNRISEDAWYRPVLVIDIKRNGTAVLNALVELLSRYPDVFDPLVNKENIQLLISGDRGPATNWNTFPTYISFDGRPFESYDDQALKRVSTISDSYGNYSKKQDSIDTLIKALAGKVHQQNKLLRLWAIPDHIDSWKHLRSLGVDIINTDNVEECRRYFGKK